MDTVGTISGLYPSDIFPSAREPMSTIIIILTTWGTMDHFSSSGTTFVARICRIEITRKGKESRKR